MSHDVDLLVVGGGPTGLATAIEARMRGLAVAVVEPRAAPVDKACGEGLMPGALPMLARLGVDPPGRPLLGVRYLDGRRRVEHRFTAPGRGVRRTELRAALASRAAELGATILPERLESFRQDADGVTGAGIRARYLVGADGLHSTVQRLAGLSAPAARARRFGLRRHYRVDAWTELIEVHWTPTAEIYVTPVAGGLVGLAVLGPRGTDFEAVAAAVPELAARLVGAEPATGLRGAGPFGQRTIRRRAGRVLLVGDAAGYVDAITGEGLRIGFAHAREAIACIAEDRPGDYERAWRTVSRDFRTLTSALVAAATSPLRGAIVPTAVAAPWAFGAIVDRLAR